MGRIVLLPYEDGKRDTREDADRHSLLAHHLHLGFVLEYERGGVEAVAEAGRGWAIVKDMAQMPPASCAEDLGTNHAEGSIADLRDVSRCEGTVEAGPSRAGVELRTRGKEWKFASGTEIDTILVIIEEVTAEGGLGSLGTQDAVDGGTELFLPLDIGLHNTRTLHDRARLTIGSNETDGDTIGIGCWRLCGHEGNHRKQQHCGQEMTDDHGKAVRC